MRSRADRCLGRVIHRYVRCQTELSKFLSHMSAVDLALVESHEMDTCSTARGV